VRNGDQEGKGVLLIHYCFDFFSAVFLLLKKGQNYSVEIEVADRVSRR